LSETENTTPSVYTEDGTVDFRGNPAVRATTWGRKTAAILLGKPFFIQPSPCSILVFSEQLQLAKACYLLLV